MVMVLAPKKKAVPEKAVAKPKPEQQPLKKGSEGKQVMAAASSARKAP
jgi:hypothetical protein